MAISGYVNIPFQVDIKLVSEIVINADETVIFVARAVNELVDGVVTNRCPLSLDGGLTKTYTYVTWDINQHMDVTSSKVGTYLIDYTITSAFNPKPKTGSFSLSILPLPSGAFVGSRMGPVMVGSPTVSFFDGDLVFAYDNPPAAARFIRFDGTGGLGFTWEPHSPDGSPCVTTGGYLHCTDPGTYWVKFSSNHVNYEGASPPAHPLFALINAVDQNTDVVIASKVNAQRSYFFSHKRELLLGGGLIVGQVVAGSLLNGVDTNLPHSFAFSNPPSSSSDSNGVTTWTPGTDAMGASYLVSVVGGNAGSAIFPTKYDGVTIDPGGIGFDTWIVH